MLFRQTYDYKIFKSLAARQIVSKRFKSFQSSRERWVDKVLFIPQAPPPQHDAAEWHSRVTFQIGPQRYLFEFAGSVTRIPPTSAPQDQTIDPPDEEGHPGAEERVLRNQRYPTRYVLSTFLPAFRLEPAPTEGTANGSVETEGKL